MENCGLRSPHNLYYLHSGFDLGWLYMHSFSESKPVLVLCIMSYSLCSEEHLSHGPQERSCRNGTWYLETALQSQRFSDKYTLLQLTFINGRSKSGKPGLPSFLHTEGCQSCHTSIKYPGSMTFSPHSKSSHPFTGSCWITGWGGKKQRTLYG